MEYRFEQTPSGRIKVREAFTPAKRWSFLVGKNEKSHTAQSRFIPILEDDTKKPTLEDLYGVDIDIGAVETCKLRFWLSLIVDEEDFTDLKPLPNLDYKVVCGDSLLRFPENWGSFIESEIEALEEQYFSETNPTKNHY